MSKHQSLHTYIKEEILNRIKANVYKKGDKIPTEYELCKHFDVSRTTVRTALNQLTVEGYLERQQGRGTFVADPKVRQTLTQTVKKFSDQIATQGKRGKIKLLSIEVIPAQDVIQNALEVDEKSPIQRIERIRTANGEPTQYEVAYIPWKTAPGINQSHAESSLYSSLKDDYNVHIAYTTEHIEIALADEKLSEVLNCEVGAPCFYIETVAEDEAHEKIEFSRSYFRGDKTSFIIERHYTKEEQA